jgi:hypothetical protein
MGDLLKANGLNVFTIETTLNNETFPDPFGFMNKREWEWSLIEQGTYLAAKKANDMAPSAARHQIWTRIQSPQGVTGINGGETEAVHERTLAAVHRQQKVEVQGQSDVLILGVPYLCPYNVDSVMNPILATCMGLGYYFNSYVGQPVVRPGGAVILYHPLERQFSQLHHPSYVDFFEEVLATSTDPAIIEKEFEEQYATDPWYVHLYRTSYAYHGVHPFYMWYWAAHAMDHVGDVVWVGADRSAAQRMGFRAASTLADALEMVSDSVGRSPSLTYLNNPPHLLADVR